MWQSLGNPSHIVQEGVGPVQNHLLDTHLAHHGAKKQGLVRGRQATCGRIPQQCCNSSFGRGGPRDGVRLQGHEVFFNEVSESGLEKKKGSKAARIPLSAFSGTYISPPQNWRGVEAMLYPTCSLKPIHLTHMHLWHIISP